MLLRRWCLWSFWWICNPLQPQGVGPFNPPFVGGFCQELPPKGGENDLLLGSSPRNNWGTLIGIHDPYPPYLCEPGVSLTHRRHSSIIVLPVSFQRRPSRYRFYSHLSRFVIQPWCTSDSVTWKSSMSTDTRESTTP